MAGVWRWNLRSGAVEWSIGVYRILGLDPVEPASFVRMESLIHPADRIDHSDLIRNAKEGVYDYRLTRIIRPSGELRWISVRAAVIYGTDGDPATLLGTVVDETRQGARLRLAQIAERELSALEGIPGYVVWRADAAGRMIEIADWAALTGTDPRSAMGTGWLSAIPITEREALIDRWASAMTVGGAFELLHHVVHADGHHKSVLTSGVPVRDAGGVVSGWIGLFAEGPRTSAISTVGAGSVHPTVPLTGAHIRAARAFLGWTAAVLAKRAEVSLSTIRRIEDSPSVPEVRESLMTAVHTALNRGGVSFWVLPGGSIGLSRMS